MRHIPPRFTRPRGGQQGIALITAIVLVAIATVLATSIGFASVMAAKRASAVFGADQALLAAEGAEAMAGYVLKQSGALSGTDSPDQVWAQPYGPYELAPDVTLQFAQIEDQQGKFNINNLASGGSAANQEYVEEFQRLLARVGLETKWANLLADWIDSDNMPREPDGAEDDVYLGQTPPYRPPNLPVSDISEILALPGFGHERYVKLAPYISALPPGTAVNLCTAPGYVLDALADTDEWGGENSTLMQLRQQGCHPTSQEFDASLPAGRKVQGQTGTTTSYYRLRTFITIGTARFSLYSLLYVDGGGQIRPIIRTFGTE